MKAIGYPTAGAISAAESLMEFETPMPVPGTRDLLVQVKGVSVNPVDVKVRANMQPENGPRILGFDASGVVKSVGSETSLFQPGDEVFYAGDLTRPGSNAEYQLVDERIVGRKPSTLDFVEASGLPLTAITAWEMLFDCFGLEDNGGQGDAILIIGAAGGVGSILIQLAKRVAGLTVIATASRPDTKAWVERMGADHVINHRNPLDQEIDELGISPRYVAALTNTGEHFPAIIKLIQPRGHVALIDDSKSLDIMPAKTKALSVSWEFMFTRPMYKTQDIQVQHELLNRVADLIDDGTLQSTVNRHQGVMTVETLKDAHEFQESGKAIGKTVLQGMN